MERDRQKNSIRTFRDLDIYRSSYRLAMRIHCISGNFPDIEKYELGKQIRRASVSVPANIAEGFGKRGSSAEFKRFLRMALGSSSEVQVYLDMIRELGYIPDKLHGDLSEEYVILSRKIVALIRTWKDFRCKEVRD